MEINIGDGWVVANGTTNWSFEFYKVLLGQPVSVVYPENQEVVDVLLDAIQRQQPAEYELFASTPRLMDFSQFTPRGHYTHPEFPKLAKYFQAMMWLGRTEIYLTAPKQGDPGLQPKEEDIQRQAIVTVLVLEATEAGSVFGLLE